MVQDRRLSAGEKRCKKQQNVVPLWFSNLFCLYNVLYGVFFLGMCKVSFVQYVWHFAVQVGVSHLATLGQG